MSEQQARPDAWSQDPLEGCMDCDGTGWTRWPLIGVLACPCTGTDEERREWGISVHREGAEEEGTGDA